MLCHSPASLAEGGGGTGAGGGLGSQPHYNLAYGESNLSFIFYPLTRLRLDAECTIPPPYPLPSLQERRGSGKADQNGFLILKETA